jgi:hypothetical protein
LKFIINITQENYEKYIKPWHKGSLRYYPLLTNYRRAKYPASGKLVQVSYWEQIERHNELVEYQEQLIKKIENDLKELPKDFQIFTETSALTVRSFNILQGEFVSWALKALSNTRRALTKEISPKTWRDLTGQKEEEEKEDAE